MMSDLIDCVLQHRNFTVCIPQTMLAELLHAGTVCDIVNVVLTLIQKVPVVLLHLRNELRGILLRALCFVIFILRHSTSIGKHFEQPRYKILLLFCRGQAAVGILEQLDTLASRNILCEICKLCRLLSPFEIRRGEKYTGHQLSELPR